MGTKLNNKELHFSYSQLKTYLMCPQKYKYQYVIGAEWEKKPAALAFGKAVHKAVENCYKHLMTSGKVPEPSETLRIFEDILVDEILNSEIDVTFKNGDSFDTLQKLGVRLLEVFHEEIRPQRVIGVEIPFSAKIPDVITHSGFLPIKLYGVFDLIEADNHNTYLICELKTSSKR